MKLVSDQSIITYLQKFNQYPFEVRLHGTSYLIGAGHPVFTVSMKEDINTRDLMTSTSLALGEAYIKGTLDIEGDLFQALDHFMGQMAVFTADQKKLKNLIFTSLSKKNQEKEVASHYDIGNDFYSLWLDDTMSYSCGYFKTDQDTLYDAQCNKVERILKKLYLKEGMTLLDIGCGWGYLLIRAAKEYGVKGVGITLSMEQKKEFEKRIEILGLSGRIKVELMDYRDLPQYGKAFDRVVSVGMVEHVGRENYDLFIKSAESVLVPGGLFLLHFISALKEYPGDPWMKKYIFPGGVVPSLREMINLLSDHQFYTLDVESLRRHYYKTLRHWDQNFNKNRNQIEKKMGTEFVRMWDLYLNACAATFHNGIIDLHQILLSKGIQNDLPLTRWY
ncbi:cyclopropane-fatty-acyl-phospholipid synthase family protein [Clostridium boliviensis]|uniref:Cyclopropane-fatty-acyl-phospholipid synthase family protein n=1 Tax=Clostridium boliviensis TaxID=318465 RepID=A0ABU4GN92_9CLOT|nr:cyclopropane-fatty-acyl-phospholipid synthase family protein [Clostridium boliviensis]MDW2799091.1 cyclopropane-fatty-acyl-phospholipid synthase family protein [Clostridium boliviensis]